MATAYSIASPAPQDNNANRSSLEVNRSLDFSIFMEKLEGDHYIEVMSELMDAPLFRKMIAELTGRTQFQLATKYDAIPNDDDDEMALLFFCTRLYMAGKYSHHAIEMKNEMKAA